MKYIGLIGMNAEVVNFISQGYAILCYILNDNKQWSRYLLFRAQP